MEVDQVNETGGINDNAGVSRSENAWSLPLIDENHASFLEAASMERFISYLDQIDTKVERLRKEAQDLQDKKDLLLVSIDLIRNHDHLQKIDEVEREEVFYYVQRVKKRLATVDLSVRTIRDTAQEESLHQINELIDSLITSRDAILSRQRCQTFLNACGISDDSNIQKVIEEEPLNIDKKFENHLLGCTLDDQKNVKKRLQALINYLNKQIIVD